MKELRVGVEHGQVVWGNQPGNPRLLSLQVVGTAVEGTKIYVNKQYWGGEEGDSVFRWFRTSSDGMQKEVADDATSSYLLSVADIGYFISVSCEPVRKDRARGPIVLSEQIGPISPGPPTCQSLEFHGSLVEGGRLTFLASYSGGGKGACFFEWFRVKDNGCKEKLHSDEPDFLKEVKQKLDLGSVKFEALCDKDKSSKKVSVVVGLEGRILEVNRKRVKVVKPGSKTSFPITEIRGSYTPLFQVEIFGNDQHRLQIVVDSDNEVDLMVQTRHLRDVIVLVIRGFAPTYLLIYSLPALLKKVSKNYF